MTDKELLTQRIKESGLRMSFISEKCGITPQGLNNKISGKSEFKQSEIQKIRKLLHLSDEDVDFIFFNEKVG